MKWNDNKRPRRPSALLVPMLSLWLPACGAGELDPRLESKTYPERATPDDQRDTSLIRVRDRDGRLQAVLVSHSQGDHPGHGYRLDCPQSITGLKRLIAGTGFDVGLLEFAPIFPADGEGSQLPLATGYTANPTLLCDAAADPRNKLYKIDYSDEQGKDVRYFVSFGRSDGQRQILHMIGCQGLIEGMGFDLAKARRIPLELKDDYNVSDEFDIHCMAGSAPGAAAAPMEIVWESKIDHRVQEDLQPGQEMEPVVLKASVKGKPDHPIYYTLDKGGCDWLKLYNNTVAGSVPVYKLGLAESCKAEVIAEAAPPIQARSEPLLITISIAPFSPERQQRIGFDVEQGRAGEAVALSGGFAMVGLPREQQPSEAARFLGAVYVYRLFTDGRWDRAQRVSDFEPGGNFGAAVAMDGRLAIVGASTAASGAVSDVGAAYLYERDDQGSYVQKAKLTPPPPDNVQGVEFGSAVDLAGDTAVVGTRTRGAFVYLRERSGGWSLLARLNPPGGDSRTCCTAVALSADFAAVTLPGDQNNPGEVHLYRRKVQPASVSYEPTQKIVGPAATGGFFGKHHAAFGYALALESGFALIGSPGFFPYGHPGKVLLYARGADDRFSLEAELHEAEGQENSATFGRGVAASGSYLLLANGGYSFDACTEGQAFLFRRKPEGGSLLVQKLLPRELPVIGPGVTHFGACPANFGSGLAIEGPNLVIGATEENRARGAVYFF